MPSYWAYLRVHSAAIRSCSFRLVLNRLAISGTSGSSGFGSVSRLHIDSSTYEGMETSPPVLL